MTVGEWEPPGGQSTRPSGTLSSARRLVRASAPGVSSYAAMALRRTSAVTAELNAKLPVG